MMGYVYVLILLGMFIPSSLQQHGTQTGPCTWENTDGSVIDLTSIGNTDGTPRWSSRTTLDPEADPSLYSLNPCYGFSGESACQNVTACRISNLGVPYDIGDPAPSSMYYEPADNTVILSYSSSNGTDRFVSRFVTACHPQSDEHQIVVYGVETSTPSTTTYKFLLLSPCACDDGCVDAPTHAPPSVSAHPIRTMNTPPMTVSAHPIRTLNTPPLTVSAHPIRTLNTPPLTVSAHPIIPPGTKSLTAGGILCIIFVCCICAYFILGAVYMYFCGGAKGMEVIPHVNFWRDLPNLIFDGFSFICSGCSARSTIVVSSSPEYDKI